MATMGNIGEQLSAARHRLGYTTVDAAARLRIRAMFVDALEREDWSTIGEFVYVRGFLKNYARLLGIDPTPLIEQLAEQYQAELAVPRLSQESFNPVTFSAMRQEEPVQSKRWFPWLFGALTAVAAVLVVMVGISLWGLFSTGNKGASIDQSQMPQTTTEGAPQATPQSNDIKAGPDDQVVADDQTTPGGVNLRLQLTQPSWLSVTVDGKRVVYETLPAGTVREFHGVREITLRAGNAGGVVANIDGKDLGALGHSGEVKDRVFAVKTPVDQLKALHE
jgi:cytoskeleton protein RodZ